MTLTALTLLATLYSIITKFIALVLILVVTPSIIHQFKVKRLYRIKTAMMALAIVAFICIIPVLTAQLLSLYGITVPELVPVVYVANSTSLLVTAGAMFAIYKVKGD